jgi:hypothetical protein
MFAPNNEVLVTAKWNDCGNVDLLWSIKELRKENGFE